MSLTALAAWLYVAAPAPPRPPSIPRPAPRPIAPKPASPIHTDHHHHPYVVPVPVGGHNDRSSADLPLWGQVLIWCVVGALALGVLWMIVSAFRRTR